MIIHNKILPINGYKAMALFPFIFVRGETVSEPVINHEKIHFAQQKELWLVGFYILYIFFHFKFGYDNNPFEIEAYKNQSNIKYLKSRKKFSWN